MSTKKQNSRNYSVVKSLTIMVDSLLQHSKSTAVILERLQLQIATPKLVICRHLSNTQGGCLEEAMVIMIVETGKEAEVARETVCFVGRYKTADKVTEGDVIVRDFGMMDNRVRVTFCLNDILVMICFLAPFFLWA